MKGVSPCHVQLPVRICDGCGREALLLDSEGEPPFRRLLEAFNNAFPVHDGPGAWLHLRGASTGGLDFCPDCLPPVVAAARACAKHLNWLASDEAAP